MINNVEIIKEIFLKKLIFAHFLYLNEKINNNAAKSKNAYLKKYD
jgi:hypothetical protein